MPKKRWQDDTRFVAWLIKKQYAYKLSDRIVTHFSGDGIVLYMYEAWCAAKEKK